LRPLPIASGSDVVGAATDAPDGAKISSFSTNALRSTKSAHGPWYARSRDHCSQNRIVPSSLAVTAARPGKTSGSAYAAVSTRDARPPSRISKLASAT
jgi:hypothetical protein